MNKTLLGKAAIQSVALMIAVVTLSYALKQYQMVTIAASNTVREDVLSMDNTTSHDDIEPTENMQSEVLPSEQMNTSVEFGLTTQISDLEDLTSSIDKNILQQLGDNYLVIKKPQASNITIQFNDLYINKSISLILTGVADTSMNSDMIYRVHGNELYTGLPIYTEMISRDVNEEDGTSKEVVTKDFGNDLSHGIIISTPEGNETSMNATQLLIELNSVYAYILYEDANYYFIDLKKPSDFYDKILVIDAGHGGKDAGALSKGKKFYEKDINIDILLHLKELLDKENIKVYYTRTADDKVFLRPRVELANAVDCDYFISIHCNANEITGPNGTEVLYYNNNFKGVSTVDLAKLFSEEIGKTAILKPRGIIEKHYEDIFIMDKAVVPMVLIEVGYLTNNNDMLYLSQSENRKAVAQGIYNGIMRAYKELPVTEEGQ